jgi:hypothetical protein
MAFPPGCISRVARTAERLRWLLSTGSCLRCYLSRIGGRISIWPCGRIHSGHLACGPSHWSHPASLTETSNRVTVRSLLELLGLVYRCSAPMDSSSSGKRSLCDHVVRSDLGFGSDTPGCLLADGVGICARVVPSVCTCIRAILGSGSMAIQELGMCPYLSLQITRSGRSYGSTVSNVCFTTHAISAQSARIGGTCSARTSRLAGGGLAGSGKRTTCDDHGDVRPFPRPACAADCGLLVLCSLNEHTARVGVQDGICKALAASDRWASALIFPLELLRSCCSYDSTVRDVSLRRDVLSVPEPARSVAVAAVRC